jgi:large subunit ribosomal protein L24
MHRIRRGDQVIVIGGKEKGKRGRVLTLDIAKQRVTIEKVNLVKRHTKPSQKQPQGGIVEKEGGLHVSNVMLLCPKCDKGVRTTFKVGGEKKKLRYCRKCGYEFEAVAK